MECKPFELQPVDFALDKLNERRQFRSCAHMGRSVLGKCFLEPCRSRKHDINLEEVDSSGQLEWSSEDIFLHVPGEQKDDKQIDSKAPERVDGQTQTLTSTWGSRIPSRAGSPRMRLSINLVLPTHNAPLNKTGRVP